MIRDIKRILKKHWGYGRFLPLQREAMECVARGRDSIVVLPTGGGKSLCFQAPAAAMERLAVVVSPLISLMKDQVDALTECGVAAARIDSTISPEEREAAFAGLREGSLRLLYVAPERLVSERFMRVLGEAEVSFIAIDEAHCISTWGHDFRPEYRKLGTLKDAFPGIALHAYTATATERVREDIAKQLRLEKPKVLVGSFDRPNLVYKVERRANAFGQVRGVVDRHRSESGIVYCIRRRDVDSMCERLRAKGYSVLPYHAGMPGEDRKRNQEAFITEKVDTIVATIAFGMGIDKSNVRYVVHAGMPKSLEHYQQESGRAGRDGLEAECVLLYSGADYGTWRKILGEMPHEAGEIALGKVNQIYDYCTSVVCRRRTILGYFGEAFEKASCGACDVCVGEVDLVEDAVVTAQKVLSCVVRLDERFGADYTAMVLTGSREQRILENRHDALSTYGLLADLSKRVVRDWIEQLVSQGFVHKTGDYNVLKATEKGWRVLRSAAREGETPRLLRPATKAAARTKRSAPAAESWEGVDRGLFEELRALRHRLAEEREVPAYVVFGDRALREMARLRPLTNEQFLAVHGVGEKKREQYGEVFLKTIRECRPEGSPGQSE